MIVGVSISIILMVKLVMMENLVLLSFVNLLYDS